MRKMRKCLCLLFTSCIALEGGLFAQTQTGTIEKDLQDLRARMNKEKGVYIRQEENETKPDTIVQPAVRTTKPDTILPKTNTLYVPETNILQKNNKWTLEACIQQAIDHNISIKQLKIQREDAKIQHNTAKNSRLPNLNATVGQEWNFGRSETDVDERQTVSTSTFGATSSIPLFTGFRIPNEIAQTKLEFEAATQNLEKAKDNLELNITSLFLQALYNKELVVINENQLQLSKLQVERTKILVAAGSVPKSQLYDIQAQVAKDKVSVVEATNNRDLALLDLAQALELERNTNFDIDAPAFDGDIIARFANSIQPAEAIYDNAVQFKPVIKEQEYKVESSQKALKIVEAGFMPTLDLNFGIGANYFYTYGAKDLVDPVTNATISANPPFSEQMKKYGNKLIGLNLSIPIFNRYQVRNKALSARLNIENQELILENNKKNLYKDIQTAYKNATASLEKYKASSEAVLSTAESFKHAQTRYESGNSSVFEFNEAKTRLVQSQSEQIQAKYDYILRTKILDFYNGVSIKL
jgi:outer membrane protein